MQEIRWVKGKAVYTTGEAAEVCNLSQQTIIRCFDSGQLKGFRVPGSKFRRIPHEALVDFMRANHIPLEGLVGDVIRVLIVDDDKEIIDLFEDALSSDGRFEIATAQTGYDAGLRTQQFHPNVIILDYMLPDINGNALCRSIRENPALQDIRIIIISGVADPADVEMLKNAGADDFIRKPFHINEVIERIVELAKA
ncbi:MAG: response regulator [Phycisphaerae bacterium]|nr:response regulator [Phycisphaerae bacterium]